MEVSHGRGRENRSNVTDALLGLEIELLGLVTDSEPTILRSLSDTTPNRPISTPMHRAQVLEKESKVRWNRVNVHSTSRSAPKA